MYCPTIQNMTNPQEKEILDKVVTIAAELEAFEPRLNGFSEQLEYLGQGKDVSPNWIDKAEPLLQNENVSEIAFNLNSLAGLYFTNKDMESAKRVCHFAYLLYKVSLGEDHPDTKVIKDNLQKLENALKPSTLPKLKRFK